MYRLTVYDKDKTIVCQLYGTLDDIIFFVENIKFQILYSFKINEVLDYGNYPQF